jgi:hypothetical protein
MNHEEQRWESCQYKQSSCPICDQRDTDRTVAVVPSLFDKTSFLSYASNWLSAFGQPPLDCHVLYRGPSVSSSAILTQ